jgi:hypothetical protein
VVQYRKKEEDLKFYNWLVPSGSDRLVEGQLKRRRTQRDHSLRWFQAVKEFQDWRNSLTETDGNVLWLVSGPGFGKSTIAGYCVDHLRAANSKVLYFFCQRGNDGLNNATDILRTISYQFILAYPELGVRLADSKDREFLPEKMEPKNMGGIEGLFKALIEGPLKTTISKDTYIVVDGIDEADWLSYDCICQDLEMSVLLRCLTSLTQRSVRLLFTTRPGYPVAAAYKTGKNIIKVFKSGESDGDIRKFVDNKLKVSVDLRARFKKAGISDSSSYVQVKARGNFIWVTTFIKALENTNSPTDFYNIMESSAGTDMEELWNNVLLRVDDGKKRWVRETLKWVVLTRRHLSTHELQTAVETSLHEKLEQPFQEFLEGHCASLLQFTQSPQNRMQVELQHDTLRDVLLNKGTDGFLKSDRAEGNVHITSICLYILSDNSLDSMNFKEYAARFWVTHLLETQPSVELLVQLHRFFKSEGLESWVRAGLSSLARDETCGLNVDVEEALLGMITGWLEKMETRICSDTENVPKSHFAPNIQEAYSWTRAVLGDKQQLGECVGRAATNVWLLDDIASFGELQTAFLLALKYYLRSQKRKRNGRIDQDIEILLGTKFKDMVVWAGIKHQFHVRRPNLGVAYFTLRDWDRCIDCFKREISSRAGNLRFWRQLGDA